MTNPTEFSQSQNQMWSSRYAAVGQDYLFGTEPNHYLVEQASRFRAGQTALLLADGEGRNSVWLAQRGLTVHALEISPVALNKARALAEQQRVGVTFHEGDMLKDEWRSVGTPLQFDWVVGIFIQFAPPSLQAIQFAHIRQWLKPGGRVLLQGYTPRQLEYKTGGPSVLENLYTAELLRHAWGDYTLEALDDYETEVAEGSGHAGRSALIGMVARKPEEPMS